MTSNGNGNTGAIRNIGIIVGLSLTFSGIIFSAGGAYIGSKRNDKVLDDHEARIRAIEKTVTRVDSNIETIMTAFGIKPSKTK